MRSALRTLTLLILALGLAACASSPRYQSTYRYEAPTDAAGRACLEKCEQKMAACSEQCATRTQACLKDLEPLVDERYNAAMNHYGAELDQYRQELVQYEFYLSMNCGATPHPGGAMACGLMPHLGCRIMSRHFRLPNPVAAPCSSGCGRNAAMWIAAASRFTMPVSWPAAGRKFPRRDASAIAPHNGVARFGL
jgi:hypothetical protein